MKKDAFCIRHPHKTKHDGPTNPERNIETAKKGNLPIHMSWRMSSSSAEKLDSEDAVPGAVLRCAALCCAALCTAALNFDVLDCVVDQGVLGVGILPELI